MEKLSGGLQMGGFCLTVKLAQGGSVTNKATRSSNYAKGKNILEFICFYVFQW